MHRRKLKFERRKIVVLKILTSMPNFNPPNYRFFSSFMLLFCLCFSSICYTHIISFNFTLITIHICDYLLFWKKVFYSYAYFVVNRILLQSGLWGQQCMSSMIAKENCMLQCVSPPCYELVYEGDPVRI